MSKRYPVQSAAKMPPSGCACSQGWVIVEIDGNLYYVKETAQ